MRKVNVVAFSSLPKGWIVEEVREGEVHVFPEQDWRIHTLTARCLCAPIAKHFGISCQVIHNSFDGRETDVRATFEHLLN